MEGLNYTLIDISYIDLIISLGLIIVAAGFSRWQGMYLEGDLIVGAIRTFIQLLAVGYILKYIFAFDRWYLIILIIIIMIIVASLTVAQRQKKRTKELPFIVGFAMTASSGITVFVVTQILLQIKPWYEPHYLIPLAGMVIGNSMNGSTLAIE